LTEENTLDRILQKEREKIEQKKHSREIQKIVVEPPEEKKSD
jgi:hypothetical protein